MTSDSLLPTPSAGKTTPNTKDPDDLVNARGEPWKPGQKPHDKRTGRPVTSTVADSLQAGLTSSQGASPASPSPRLDLGVERTTTVTSGRKCLRLYDLQNPHGSSLKMLVGYLLGTKVWSSSRCALIWRAQATKSSRLLFQLRPLALPIDEIESGLLHTPAAQEPNVRAERLQTKAGSPAKVGERAYDKKTGRLAQVGLEQQINMRKPFLHTPRATMPEETPENFRRRMNSKRPNDRKDGMPNLAVQVGSMLKTPTAGEPEGGMIQPDSDQWDIPGARFKMRDQVGRATGLKLQPPFVAWMMGYPLDWTDLNSPSPNTAPNS